MRIIGAFFTLLTLFTCSNRNEQKIEAGSDSWKSVVIESKKVVVKEIPLKRMIDSFRVKQESIRILILKNSYQLKVYSDTMLLKTYPVVFGFNPKDDKLREGDGCTPEGKFTIRDKYPHASWSKFLWIDYPNADSWKKHKEAKAKGMIPSNAAIGGEVGIHGVPDGADFAIDQKQNWTLGCISLKNKDVNEIYPYITKSTVIEIRK